MFAPGYRHDRSGFSLIEALIAIAILSLVFAGLFSALQLMLQLITKSKAETGALAIANEQIEYIRSLPYDSIGTVGGIPDGPIPQSATTSLNGGEYTIRTLVQYVDAPEDGTGAGDVNGILADYKKVKVEISWWSKTATETLSLISNIVPRGVETVAGGGTLRVNVFDAAVQPVSGASVRVYNDTTTSTIDTTVFTNIVGTAMFSGAPAAADYQITVTNTDYSTDQTYTATTSNPNPITPHVAVLESQVSTMNFQIDRLSDLEVRTVGTATNGQFEDLFDDTSKIASSTNISVTGGVAELSGSPGPYVASGTILAASSTPASIESWSHITWQASTSASTSVIVQVYELTGTSTYTLIPDGDLANNSTGFTSSPIDISGLAAGTYPGLVLGATLTTIDANETPELLEWQLIHIENQPNIPNVPFSLTGNKTIGTTAALDPIYKYSASHTTDGTGDYTITDLEWDLYELTLDTGSYDISQACSNLPYSLDPNVSETLTVTLVSATALSLRVRVEDVSGDPIVDADVDLARSGFSDSGVTSICGQTFFNSALTSATDYQLDVDATGYDAETVTGVAIEALKLSP